MTSITINPPYTTGTIILTGANGTLGIPAATELVSKHQSYTTILTVRDDSNRDPNTQLLQAKLTDIPNANYTITKLDLNSLSSVTHFAQSIRTQITQGNLPPLSAVVCNAATWSVITGLRFSADGYEQTMAVNHLAQFSLVLRLLGSFDKTARACRVVFLASEAHAPGGARLEHFRPELPSDLDILVKPPPDKEEEVVGRGFQRYGVSKLVLIMCMYELNRRLEGTNISALAMDPGQLVNSRAFSKDVPPFWGRMLAVVNFLQPVLKMLEPRMHRGAESAPELVALTVGEEYAGKTGYFDMTTQTESSPESQDVEKQRRVWEKSVEWCELKAEDTIVEI